MTEASLEVMACNWANLEDEAQDLKSKLHQLPSQVRMKLNVLTINMQDKVFQDALFHRQLSFVFSLQVIYYSFIIFIMHSFLKLFHSAICIKYFLLMLFTLRKVEKCSSLFTQVEKLFFLLNNIFFSDSCITTMQQVR